MVNSVTNYGRNGLSDWLVQRMTALIIGVYFVFLFIYFLCHPDLTYQQWHGLFDYTIMRICTLLVVLSICAHAWVGLWTVFTDYVKCACLRVTLEVILVLLLLTYVIWAISILWR
ncbi:MAG: succinate dehydrogenase, hydrophobic membrane anchor protein [Coxiellaceae bacterium]|nr:succinate dehydrogenase, hydrophobic membrane anchor protein [Coxiellaceae bacterium]